MATIYLSLSQKVNLDRRQEILIRFSHGKKINQRAKTNTFILSEHWDEEKQSIIIPNYRLMNDERKAIKATLTKQAEKLNSLTTLILTSFEESDKNDIAPDWLKRTIDAFCFPEKYEATEETEPEQSFFDVFSEFLEKRKLSEGRKASFRVVVRTLQRYELYVRFTDKGRKDFQLSLDEFTPDILRHFVTFLKDEHIIQEKFPKIYDKFPTYHPPKPRGQNTINGTLVKLRTLFIWSVDNDKTTNNPFRKYKIDECIYGTPVYITIEERNKIYETDFTAFPELEIQRDIFVFQCLIGCRIGDLYRMTWDNVINDAIEYVPRKTKEGRPVTVRVPLNATAKEILMKYEDRDKDGNTLLPFINDQLYNESIKEIFAIAGITRKVTVLNPLTRESEVRPINEIASSHLARRTFVGNLYKKVKDPSLVGSLSGHKEGSRAFARYREIDEEMKKELVNMIE